MKIWGKTYVCNAQANALKCDECLNINTGDYICADCGHRYFYKSRLSDQPPTPPLAWIGGTQSASVAVDLEPYCEWQDVAADDAGVPRFGEI